MRLALFGGSFDPPHRGHIAIAQAAAQAFALDRVLFAPAGRQPLKRDGHAASYGQRLAMVARACSDANGEAAALLESGKTAQQGPCRFEPSDLDAPHADGRPNYTVDTLEALAAAFPSAQLFNLAGADSFQYLASWRSPLRVIELAEWIVVSRPGVPLVIPEGLALTPALRARVHLLDSVHHDIAATQLRQRLARGENCRDLLSPSVAAYIEAHHLYTR